MRNVLLEATDTKEFSVSVDEKSYLTFTVSNMVLKIPIEGRTIGEIHDTTQNLLQDLVGLPGVQEVLAKHGAIIELNGRIHK